MQDALVGGWARQPHFSAELLASLHDLNHRFLDLLWSDPAVWRAPRKLALPADVPARIAPLSTAQRAAAAHCPYALFDLRFEDAGHWRQRLDGRAEWRVGEALPIDDEVADFVRLALFYAWHVASTTRLAAQLLLGMNEHTAAAFRGVSLNCLPALVSSEAHNLCARWRTRGAYWNALLAAASRADEPSLRKVHLFGLQLAAAARLP